MSLLELSFRVKLYNVTHVRKFETKKMYVVISMGTNCGKICYQAYWIQLYV
jgi:hypothetical protein